MKTNYIYTILIILVLSFLGIASLQAAVSLQSKISYMESLKQEALTLENQGYYDQSVEKSLEVQQLSKEIDSLIVILKKWYLLQRNIAVAKQVKADEFAPEEFNLAVNFYNSAEKAFVDEDFAKAESDVDEGLYYIDLAIEKAQNSFQSQDVEEKSEAQVNVELTKVDGEYVVRLIPQRRDCLWRIAEYDFIYGNPWQWKLIYNANQNIIEDPDLIYPGQKLVIPPLPFEPELE